MSCVPGTTSRIGTSLISAVVGTGLPVTGSRSLMASSATSSRAVRRMRCGMVAFRFPPSSGSNAGGVGGATSGGKLPGMGSSRYRNVSCTRASTWTTTLSCASATGPLPPPCPATTVMVDRELFDQFQEKPSCRSRNSKPETTRLGRRNGKRISAAGPASCRYSVATERVDERLWYPSASTDLICPVASGGRPDSGRALKTSAISSIPFQRRVLSTTG